MNAKKIKIYIVLPMFNEELNIGNLLHKVERMIFNSNLDISLIAVDDGSTDNTSSIVKNYSERIPIVNIIHKTNMGLGSAIRSGLLKVMELADADDIAVVMDSDDSHPPELIMAMVQKISEGYDVVIASRFRKQSRCLGVPLSRKIISLAASVMMRLLFPIKGVRDYTCGYRAYRVEILQKAKSVFSDSLFDQTGFQCMVDLLLKLRKSGAVIAEVPLLLRYDLKKGKSKMKVLDTIAATLRMIIGNSIFLKKHP